MPQPVSPRIVVAMDFANQQDCLNLADRLDPAYCRLKVGKELFTVAGPQVVEGLMKKGFDVFLDLKFHDIPNTAAKAVKAAAEMGVWMVNVHASGGERMMAAARDELEKRSGLNPLLIAVTVLTSMESNDLAQIGIKRSPEDQVIHLANLAQKSGMDGVVCSAQESPLLSSRLGPDFCLVTPGIRLPDSAGDDQRRIVTPEKAIADGSHYLVIGRPITQAQDPVSVCKMIAESIS